MTSAPAAFRPSPAVCLLVVALLLAASGCGEESTAARKGTETARSLGKANAGSPAGRASAAGCPKQLGAFVDSLGALRRQLAVGLAYDDYVARVKRLRASYREIPVQRLTLDCLAAGTPAEQALNEHVDAANAWGECLARASCTTAAIEPVLQRGWRIAARHLSEAR